MDKKPCIIIHGGIESKDKSTLLIERLTSCRKAACIGYKNLLDGKSAAIAAEAALRFLEDDEFFNCGYGSVLNENGEVQMDSSIMNGTTRKGGSVVTVSHVDHPISIAEYLMRKMPNTIVVGNDATNLAKKANKVTIVSKGGMNAPSANVAFRSTVKETTNPIRKIANLLIEDSTDTAGCVVWDGKDIVSAATSGGLNKKLVGRVGDCALLGCGIFADQISGCSLTGHGESIMKLCLARNITEQINSGLQPEEALKQNLDEIMSTFGKVCGGIVLKNDGTYSAHFTGSRLVFCYIKDNLVTYGSNSIDKKTIPFAEYFKSGVEDFECCSCK